MEELIEVLDCNGNKTGEIKPKSEIKKAGNYHRAIAVCIVNDKKEIIMQRRSKNKKVYANLWSIFVKGHVRAGETSEEACIREINEELGISVKKENLEYLYTIQEELIISEDYIERIFFDVFLARKNVKIDDVKIQEEELEEAKLVYYMDVENLVKNSDDMVPNPNDYEKIFKLI
ncbi:MAG: NUDIX domain-containing protein [Clostridia bacterium]|nr:NUDIX domain-containing protein [Clostridia bacterium]